MDRMQTADRVHEERKKEIQSEQKSCGVNCTVPYTIFNRTKELCVVYVCNNANAKCTPSQMTGRPRKHYHAQPRSSFKQFKNISYCLMSFQWLIHLYSFDQNSLLKSNRSHSFLPIRIQMDFRCEKNSIRIKFFFCPQSLSRLCALSILFCLVLPVKIVK